MKVEVKRINTAYGLAATNESGETVQMDGSKGIGGHEAAFRPMQMLLAALGGCSSIDVISLMNKQREPLKALDVTIEATRQQDVVPSLFESIHVHYVFYGDVSEQKAKKAVKLSMDTYCSVAKTLEKAAPISWSFEVKQEA